MRTELFYIKEICLNINKKYKQEKNPNRKLKGDIKIRIVQSFSY